MVNVERPSIAREDLRGPRHVKLRSAGHDSVTRSRRQGDAHPVSSRECITVVFESCRDDVVVATDHIDKAFEMALLASIAYVQIACKRASVRIWCVDDEQTGSILDLST